MQKGIIDVDFKKELEDEVNEMDKVKDYLFFSGFFTMEEVHEFEKYIKEQKDIISYLK